MKRIEMDTKESRIRGTIYGQAIGDALGVGAEFLTKDKVANVYPNGIPHYRDINWSWGFARPWKKGEWTDDTDQMLCIFDSLLKHDGDFLPKDIARRFYRWYIEDGRGCGATTQSILTAHGYVEIPYQVAQSRWEESGMSNAPNGAVMRTAAVGLFYDSASKTKDIAKDIAQLTHWDPRCVASAQIISVIIQQFVQGIMLSAVRSTARAMLVESDNVFCPINDMPYLQAALDGDIESLELGTDGKSFGYTVKTLGAGLWALSDLARDFESGIQAVIREGGDVDTNCAVAGAVLGARFGYESLPQDLVQGLVRAGDLEERILKLLRYWKI